MNSILIRRLNCPWAVSLMQTVTPMTTTIRTPMTATLGLCWMRRDLSSKSKQPTPPTTTTTPAPHEQTTLTIHSETASLPQPFEVPTSQLAPVYVASDVPDDMLTKKRARIFRPAKNAMQSGVNESRYWQLDFDTEDKWENKLMGWSSSGDAVQALRVRFHNKEEAILFAEKQGWDYIVQEDQRPIFKKKSYSDNYKYYPGKLPIVKTK